MPNSKIRMAASESPGNEGTEEKIKTVNVEITEPLEKMISELKNDEDSLEEWIQQAVRMRFSLEGERHCKHDVQVYIPNDVQEWAELRAEDARLRGNDVRLTDFIFEHLEVQPQLEADEEVLSEESTDVE